MAETEFKNEILQEDAAFIAQLRARFAPKPSQEQLISEALRVLQWVVEEIAQGRTIHSCDKRLHPVEPLNSPRTVLCVIRE